MRKIQYDKLKQLLIELRLHYGFTEISKAQLKAMIEKTLNVHDRHAFTNYLKESIALKWLEPLKHKTFKITVDCVQQQQNDNFLKSSNQNSAVLELLNEARFNLSPSLRRVKPTARI